MSKYLTKSVNYFAHNILNIIIMNMKYILST